MTFNVDDLEVEQSTPKERDNQEFKIQCAIIDHVRTRKAFNVFICAIFQGRDAKQGFFLKMMGVIPGVADLLVLWRSECKCGTRKIGIGFMEVKKPGGVQSTAQHKFAGVCHWLGIPYSIVRSVQQAHTTLVLWGCKKNHAAIREPDTRTETQKNNDAFEIYKP